MSENDGSNDVVEVDGGDGADGSEAVFTFTTDPGVDEELKKLFPEHYSDSKPYPTYVDSPFKYGASLVCSVAMLRRMTMGVMELVNYAAVNTDGEPLDEEKLMMVYGWVFSALSRCSCSGMDYGPAARIVNRMVEDRLGLRLGGSGVNDIPFCPPRYESFPELLESYRKSQFEHMFPGLEDDGEIGGFVGELVHLCVRTSVMAYWSRNLKTMQQAADASAFMRTKMFEGEIDADFTRSVLDDVGKDSEESPLADAAADDAGEGLSEEAARIEDASRTARRIVALMFDSAMYSHVVKLHKLFQKAKSAFDLDAALVEFRAAAKHPDKDQYFNALDELYEVCESAIDDLLESGNLFFKNFDLERSSPDDFTLAYYFSAVHFETIMDDVFVVEALRSWLDGMGEDAANFVDPGVLDEIERSGYVDMSAVIDPSDAELVRNYDLCEQCDDVELKFMQVVDSIELMTTRINALLP